MGTWSLKCVFLPMHGFFKLLAGSQANACSVRNYRTQRYRKVKKEQLFA